MAAVGEYELRGVHVAFPFEPYPSQLVFMDRVIEALQAPHRNALLESPTGTGKTLCLLCASLAWRQMHKAQRQVDQLGLAPVTAQGAAMLKQLAAGAGGREREWLGGRAVAPEAPAQFGMAPAVACRIIYVSRTHGQLSQVVRELRNTTYRPNVSILGSRQQYCVHHDVKKVPGGQRQNAQCQKLVATQSCQFHRNVVDHKYQHKEVLTDALDIEDLVKHGEKHKVCPYYLTRDTANDADVIFMPYNYLTDPASRKSLAHLWKDSVVIFDEAHNMESICSEAASFDLTHTDIAMCVTEVDRCTSIKESGIEFTTTEPATQEELSILKIILRSFEDALAALPLKGSPASATFPGCKIYELFETAGVKHDNATELFAMVSKTMSMLAEAQGAGIQANPSLKKFSDALEAVFKASDMANCNRLYKMHITEEPERKGKRAGPQSITDLQPTLTLKPGQKPRQIGYWCFSAGVTMKEILDQGVRNVVLASGTLSPMSSWATEMQMNFEVKLENKHVIREDQLLAAVVRKGPSGVTLNSSYKNRENVQSVDDLGNLIVNVCRIVPANSGVLVFFPSYAALTAGTERWKQGSVWDRISKQKQIFIEPRESGSFKMTICAYTDEVDRAGSNGAVLMAVCRGKMSEGIDFADRHGRAVIVTGIPFPAAFDPRVVLKKAFMDELMPEARAEGREAVSGEQWYIQQAARAVNQAIGRVIRHRNDYGVILLCDERFANWTKQSLLSKWMKDNVQVMDLFGPIAAKLTQFFQKHKQAEAPAHREGVSAQGSNAGLVTIHTQAGAVVKARRQQDQKIPTSFQFEQEYLMHKDKSKESRIGVCGSGLGSWMSELDGDSSHPPASSAASKPAARPTSLADQLISLRANASSGTPASSRSPAPPTMKSETTPVTVARKDARGTFQVSPPRGDEMAKKLDNKPQPQSTGPSGTQAGESSGSGAGGEMAKKEDHRPQPPSAGAAKSAGGVRAGTADSGGARGSQSGGGGDSSNGAAFMEDIKQTLAQEDYKRFKKAIHALKRCDEQTRNDAFDELHAVLGKPDSRHAMQGLAKFLSAKLRDQLRTHLAGKGFAM